MKRRAFLRTDFTIFMSLVFMLAGCLLAILISNLAVVIVDPANVVISGIIRAPGMESGTSGNADMAGRIYAHGNVDKRPHFVDVRTDSLVFYPGERRVPLTQLSQAGNPFDNLLDSVAANKSTDYVVLLVRPGTATLTRKLRTAVTTRGIDVGLDIYEADQRANYGRALREQKKEGA